MTDRVVFLGAVHEARPALAALLAKPEVRVAAVVTPTATTAGRMSGAVDLTGLARAAGVPILRTDNVNAPDIVAAIRGLAPDLLVVVGWTRLLGSELLAVPERGCVGFHASLLPHHRGRAPVNWSILRGESITGNTMLMLDPGVDTGDIVDQRPVLIRPADTCRSVYRRVAAAGADMLASHLPALLAGTGPRRRQNPAEGDVLPKRTPEMGVIDWRRSARAVHDWVRAVTAPYPGAFGSIDGRRVMIWRTLVPGEPERTGPAGRVLGLTKHGVRIATGCGSVVVTAMSAPAQRPEPALRWCQRNGVRPGTRFDLIPPELASWARGEGPRTAT